MGFGFLEIAVTPAVRSVQKKLGVAHMWGNFKGRREFDRFSDREAAFIAGRDSFYMATTSETGWPYLQHRGGPGGFLKLLDDRTLAFADYRGDFQYISVGNLSANDKACLFLMDYPRRARLKIYVRAEIVSLDVDPVLIARVLEGTAPKWSVSSAFILKLSTGIAPSISCPASPRPSLPRRYAQSVNGSRLSKLRMQPCGLPDNLRPQPGTICDAHALLLPIRLLNGAPCCSGRGRRNFRHEKGQHIHRRAAQARVQGDQPAR